jgi:primary-amine oxidase
MTFSGWVRWVGWLACAAGCFLTETSAAKRAEDTPSAKGTHVEWGGWSFRWSVRRREGVVLSQVSYAGKSVLKFAGIAEVFVPYNAGSPRIEDLVQHPLGENLIPLRPGVDCLPGGTCTGFDKFGKRADKNPVVMMHEEEQSLVYLGRDGRGHGKMLVLWSAHELGDYTYFVQWRFRDDGCLMPRVGLTGKLAHFGGDDKTGTLVGAPERALSHVHNVFFCLDLDVDGTRNTVEEFEFKPTSAAREKAVTRWHPITREGGRELDPHSFRSWRVVNHGSKNAWKQPRSYELIPAGTGIFRGMHPRNPKLSLAEPFAHFDVWVTRYHPNEVPPAKPLRDTLPTFVNGESVENEDVVLWYMMSMHHQPRAEDWPAMPVDWHGFKLMPRDFLDKSPVSPSK